MKHVLQSPEQIAAVEATTRWTAGNACIAEKGVIRTGRLIRDRVSQIEEAKPAIRQVENKLTPKACAQNECRAYIQ